jgi:hypothetical protein
MRPTEVLSCSRRAFRLRVDSSHHCTYHSRSFRCGVNFTFHPPFSYSSQAIPEFAAEYAGIIQEV